MQPITKRYQNGDRFNAEDINQFIETINAGLTPEVVLNKENIKIIVTKFVYDIVLIIYSRLSGASEKMPPLSLKNDILEISNVLNEDLSAAIKEKLQFKLTMSEDFDGLTLNELCDMVNEVMSVIGIDIDMEVSEGVTIRDFIEKAYDDFVPQFLTVIRNLFGTSLNQAFIMTEPLDTNIDAFIKM